MKDGAKLIGGRGGSTKDIIRLEDVIVGVCLCYQRYEEQCGVYILYLTMTTTRVSMIGRGEEIEGVG